MTNGGIPLVMRSISTVELGGETLKESNLQHRGQIKGIVGKRFTTIKGIFKAARHRCLGLAGGILEGKGISENPSSRTGESHQGTCKGASTGEGLNPLSRRRFEGC